MDPTGEPTPGGHGSQEIRHPVEMVRAREGRRFFEASEGIGAKVAGAMMRRGVIARAMPQGDILGFAPPLCLTESEADTIVEVTAEAVAEALG